MRKIVAIILCTVCLSFSTSVKAQSNVTNQLDEILVQLDNLDQVIQFFIDSQEDLEWWISGDFFMLYIEPFSAQLKTLIQKADQARTSLMYDIAPDVASIKDAVASIQSDVAALSADLAVFVSQIVSSINGVTSEVYELREWLVYIGLDNVENILTQAQLDQSLYTFLQFLTNDPFLLDTFSDYSSVLSQILQSIQSLDYSYQVEDALYNIALALDNLSNISITIDLQDILDELELNIDLDLGTALSSLESNLSSALSTLEYFSYAFQEFVNLFVHLKNDQELTNDDVRDFVAWYQNYFFPGLREHLTLHGEWLLRQGAIEEAEAEHRAAQDDFLTGDATFPTDSEVPYLVELEEALMKDEIEVPDDKIYGASEEVKTDMEDVEQELTGAMDLVDEAFSGFLEDVRFNWGSFNSELSFTYTLPFNDYTMELSYDFATSPLRAPCRAASVGIWGIVLFVQSYLSIVSAIKGVTEN